MIDIKSELVSVAFSGLIGVTFITIGIIASKFPPKIPWIFRFFILFIGIGYMIYTVAYLLGIVE